MNKATEVKKKGKTLSPEVIAKRKKINGIIFGVVIAPTIVGFIIISLLSRPGKTTGEKLAELFEDFKSTPTEEIYQEMLALNETVSDSVRSNYRYTYKFLEWSKDSVYLFAEKEVAVDNYFVGDRCPIMEVAIQETMNDPSSFKEISSKLTRWDLESKTIEMFIEFSGNNVFGGRVVNNAIGVIDFNGNVLSIEYE